ncbi:MAG: hypothetical protein FWF08_03075 [Oscillospiraceae bacterium]|nr:hypothetical protein [Oscillospiraceae bacterium]
MMKKVLSVIFIALLLFPLLFAFSADAAEAKSADGYSWVGSWSTSPVPASILIGTGAGNDFIMTSTLRTVIQMTLGGDQVRLRFTNKYGKGNVKINEVALARTDINSDTAIVPDTSVSVTFGGQSSVTLPPSGYVVSDPIDMSVVSLEKLSVSYYVSYAPLQTAGLYGGNTYISTLGNKIFNEDLSNPRHMTLESGSMTYYVCPYLCGADVYAKDAFSIVIIGDSTVVNKYPYYLAEKLVLGGVKNIGVLQQGIIGNRILYDGDGVGLLGYLYGKSLLSRFTDDALEQPGVKYIVVKEGINDVLHPMTKSMIGKAPYASEDDIIGGYTKIINMAKDKGITIYFMSRTPWEGYTRDFVGGASGGEPDLQWTQEAENVLINLNFWLEYSSGCNGFINLDSMRDPNRRSKFKEGYSTDGAHLSEMGCRVMADLTPLSYFGLDKNRFEPIVTTYNSGRGGVPRTSPVQQKATTTTTLTTAAPTTTVSMPPVNTDNNADNPPDQNNYTPNTPYTEEPATAPPEEVTTAGQHEQIYATSPHVTTTQNYFITTQNLMPMYNTTEETQEYSDPYGDLGYILVPPSPQEVEYGALPPEEPETLSPGTKAWISLFTVLSLGTASWGAVRFVNKKKMM